MTGDAAFFSLLSGFFIAGFIGSWHCAIMCGPMTCLLASKKQLAQYQIGRLISYVAAGVFAGTISSLLIESYDWLKPVSVLTISILLIITFFTKSEKVQTPGFVKRIYWTKRNNSFLMGLFSLALPCGWLYSFIISALAARSPLAGGLVMFMFWLSSLPALSVAQIFLKKLIDINDLKRQKVASVVLLFASLFSLWGFLLH
jgi:hypothetical protein